MNYYQIHRHPFHFLNGKWIAIIGSSRFEMTEQQARECVEFVEEERTAGREPPPNIAAKYTAAELIMKWRL